MKSGAAVHTRNPPMVPEIAGSPVVQITWFTILLGALAPVIRPMPVTPYVSESSAASSRPSSIASLMTRRSRQMGNAASSAHAEK